MIWKQNYKNIANINQVNFNFEALSNLSSFNLRLTMTSYVKKIHFAFLVNLFFDCVYF